MNDDGTERRLLTPGSLKAGPLKASALAWSPDGTQLAFTRYARTQEARGNFILRANGTGERRIGSGEWPQPSPDGKSVLIWKVAPDGESASIIVRSLDGLRERVVANGSVRNPAWSPDGRTIAFVGELLDWATGPDFAGSVLETISRDGSGLREIVEGRDDGSTFGPPAWTSDGSGILVAEYYGGVSYGAGGRFRRIGLDGKGVATHWEDDPSVDFDTVAFALDGTKAAFLSDKGLETISLDKGKRALLVKGELPLPERFDGGLMTLSPVWSPDGEKLAYIADGLHVMNQDGSNNRVVSKPGENVLSFAWRPPRAKRR